MVDICECRPTVPRSRPSCSSSKCGSCTCRVKYLLKQLRVIIWELSTDLMQWTWRQPPFFSIGDWHWGQSFLFEGSSCIQAYRDRILIIFPDWLASTHPQGVIVICFVDLVELAGHSGVVDTVTSKHKWHNISLTLLPSSLLTSDRCWPRSSYRSKSRLPGPPALASPSCRLRHSLDWDRQPGRSCQHTACAPGHSSAASAGAQLGGVWSPPLLGAVHSPGQNRWEARQRILWPGGDSQHSRGGRSGSVSRPPPPLGLRNTLGRSPPPPQVWTPTLCWPGRSLQFEPEHQFRLRISSRP